MVEPKKSSHSITGPLISVLLGGLQKVIGPSYGQLLEGTAWQRYLKRPPSTDPSVPESNDEELSQVFGHIYQQVGKDLFIAFGRYAALEGGKTFASMLAPAITPALVGLSGVARLQRMVELAVALVPWAFPLTLHNIPTGVDAVYLNCAICKQIKSDEPVCNFLGDGLKGTYTTIGGVPVAVKEVVCQAQGKAAECVFRITLRDA